MDSFSERAPCFALVVVVAVSHPGTNNRGVAPPGCAPGSMRIAANRILHLAIIALEFGALFYHSFCNRPVDRDEAEFIPTFVNHDIGHADSIPGHDIASYLGCVGLPPHAASVDRSDV